MLCTYCNAPRMANDAPCPQCGAPSPLMGSYGAAPPSAMWGNTSRNTSDHQWNNPSSLGSLPPTAPNDNPSWAPMMGAPAAMQPPAQTQLRQDQSLLPVPYQNRTEATYQPMMLMAPDPSTGETLLLPVPTHGSLAPSGFRYPGSPDEDESIHIPPMYTKPRAIIPRYRIISGLLSVLIVFTVLCTGAGYLAKVSGRFAFLDQLWGDARPQNLPATASQPIPDPSPDLIYGPAKNIINSASTASKIDPQTNIALQPTNVFSPGQVIYLTYSVHPKSAGVVVLKWYTNDLLYKTMTSPQISDAKNGKVTMQFTQPIAGKVELYWNNQLAIALFFVVR